MTPEQVVMVKDTWAQVKPMSERTAELFYNKLFETDPVLQPLFKGDMKSQGRKLMTMINTAVVNLDKLDEVVGAVEDLGKRHVGYGVKDSDYDTVGGALLWSLEQGLGESFTEEVKAAWTETYVTLAGLMKNAAAQA